MDRHNISNNKNLTIGLWNCNSMKSHKDEIIDLINRNQTHIFCINETKLKHSINIDFNNHDIIRKDRNTNGGGVATILHTSIEHERVNTLDHFGLELIAAKIKLNNKYVHIINIYIPPRKSSDDKFLDEEFFQEVDKLKPYIICGDLNSKSSAWGCKEDNTNGVILSELVSNSSASVMNNNQATHRFNTAINGEYSESIIDMFIISGDLLDKTVSFRVNKNHNYFGHFPITASFDIPAGRIANKSDIYRTKTINWEKFKSTAEERINNYFDNNCKPKEGPGTLKNYYQMLCKVIMESDEAATEEKTRNRAHRTLPNQLLSIIEARKKTVNELRKVKSNSILFRELKSQYNRLTKTIREEGRNRSTQG